MRTLNDILVNGEPLTLFECEDDVGRTSKWKAALLRMKVGEAFRVSESKASAIRTHISRLKRSTDLRFKTQTVGREVLVKRVTDEENPEVSYDREE